MAKKVFLSDLDLTLNQLLSAKLENLATDPSATESRVYYNTTTKKVRYHNGTIWIDLVNDADSRLTDARTPTAHVIATNTGLGAQHTISGAGAGQVLRASSATAANFQQLAHTDLSGIGTNSHAAIDTHIADDTKHRMINDAGTSNIDLFSAEKILALIADINSTITGGLINKGGYNAATNTPMLDTTPIAGIKNGWTYTVTAAGTFFTENVQIGDMIIAKQDNPTTLAHWTLVNKNIPDILDASETQKGIVELATNAESLTGTDNTRAVHPQGLKYVLDNRTATEVLTGLIELATQAEAIAGTDTTRAITPATLKAVLGTSATLSMARKYAQVLSTSQTIYTITHNLNTSDVVVSVRDTATPYNIVEVEVAVPSVNTVTLGFNVAPTANKYSVTVIG